MSITAWGSSAGGPLLTASGSVSSSGNNTLLTPDSGKRLRIYYLSYIVGGANLSGSLTRLLTADPANYTLIGSDAGLRLTDIVMGAVPGVYVITGQAAYALLDIASFPGGSGGFIIIVND